MANNKLFGSALVKVDGGEVETFKGATFDPGGVTRTTQTGSVKVLGYTEEPRPSKLECEVAVRPGMSVDRINKLTDATITFRCDTGQTYVVAGGWNTGETALTEGEGKAKTVFEGPPAEELVS
jgi:hypothetical protein